MSRPIVTAIGMLLAVILEVASGGAASSDGERAANTKIAFSCAGDICIVNADGTGRRKLTRDKFINSYPSWSPDGRTIAFTQNLGRTLIYVVNADGSGRSRLTPRGGDDALPAWSPDGGTIAFDNNTTGQIYLMDADGSRRRPLARRTASLPAWSPDGNKIAFVAANGRRLSLTSGDIYVTYSDGTHPRRLVRNGTFPAWSPDGKQIAFLRNKRRWSKNVDVWIMNADGSRQHRLWTHSAEGGGLSWSPDGSMIALTCDGDIYIIGADGSSRRRLTTGWGDNLDPAWQPTHDGPEVATSQGRS
jgi:TolB protein